MALGLALSGSIQGTGGGGTAPAPSLLPITATLTNADNSYGKQTGNIDVFQYQWNAMGCVGLPTVVLNQSRGGDRIGPHLIDRKAPLLSGATAGLASIMNVENDLADAAVTNDNTGGDLLLARIDDINSATTGVRSVGGKTVVFKQGNTTAAISKSTAITRYHAGLATRDLVAIDDPNDYQNAADSSDGTHPNKTVSARRLGLARAAVMRPLFASTKIFDAGGSLAGNFYAAGALMSTAPVLTNNTTCTATLAASTDVTRGIGSVPAGLPCRKLTVSGTNDKDPTQSAAAAGGDIQLRFATPHAVGTNTYAKTPCCICFIEITNAAGGNPANLATVLLQSGPSSAFGKLYVSSTGVWNTGLAYGGTFGTINIRSGGVQSLTLNTDFVFRTLTGAGVDFEVRIAYLNVFYTDEVAYGKPANASAIFTTGRPPLYALPTSTPASGPQAVPATLGVSTGLATIAGGGLTRTYDAVRDSTTDVGDAFPPSSLAVAIPYVSTIGDQGHTLEIRTNANNAFLGAAAVSVSTTAIAFT